MLHRLTHRDWLLRGLLTALAVTQLSPIARAAPIAFTVTMAETEAVVADPSDMMAAMMAAWQTQHVLMVQRKMPWIQFSVDDNPSTSSTAQMTSMRINIGDPALYSFDWASIVSTSPGVTVTTQIPTAVIGEVRSDFIDLLITGLTKGKYVRLHTDLVSDPGNPVLFPDYRVVMFDMNSNNPNGNSSFVATFQDGNGPPITETLVFPDQSMLYPTNIGIGFKSSYTMDHVQAFSASGGAELVPEPSTIVMGGFGVLGMIGFAWRRRRMPVPIVAA